MKALMRVCFGLVLAMGVTAGLGCSQGGKCCGTCQTSKACPAGCTKACCKDKKQCPADCKKACCKDKKQCPADCQKACCKKA